MFFNRIMVPGIKTYVGLHTLNNTRMYVQYLLLPIHGESDVSHHLCFLSLLGSFNVFKSFLMVFLPDC